MSTSKFHNRTALLRMFMEQKFSVSIGNEIMHLFKNIKEEKKEELAKELISVVKTSKDEQEALQKAKVLVAQMER